MNSPSGCQPELPRSPVRSDAFATQLTSCLQTALQSRHDATPEPEFDTEYVEDSYEYLCANQRKRFPSPEVERLRQSIPDTQYWKVEANLYRTVLEKHLALTQEVDSWRAAANGYRSVCYLLGLAPAEVEQCRRTINNPNYCHIEWDLLERQSHIHEYKMAEQCRQSAEQLRSAEHRKAAAKRRRLSKRAARHPCAHSISSRTRSKTREVAKPTTARTPPHV
jgi:hypothetical protein